MAGVAAREFISQLRAGSIRRPLTLIGIVKSVEGSDQSLMFSTGRCEDWIELPEKAISEIHTLGMAPCKDHQHPRVRIELVQSDDPTVSALATVLMNVISQRRSPEPTTTSGVQHGTLANAQPRSILMRRSSRIGHRHYFRLTADCDSDHPNCLGDVSTCPNGCACCDDGGECFCSDCCIS
jgi:hypothetical protein